MTCRSFLFRSLVLCAVIFAPVPGADKAPPRLPSDELPLTPPKNAIAEVGGQETDISPDSGDAKAIAEGARADLAGGSAVFDLQPHLVPYDGPEERSGARKTAGQIRWYVFTAANPSALPVSRILLAGSLPGHRLHFVPDQGRTALVRLISASAYPVITPEPAYGKAAFRVRLPPHAAADIALGLRYGADPPSVLAWVPEALAAHQKGQVLYQASVLTLLAVVLSLAGALMLLSHRPAQNRAARWTFALLLTLFLIRLAQSGCLDGALMTPVGGPFGLESLCVGLALICALRLTDVLLPVPGAFRRRGRFFLWGESVLTLLAWLGVPGAALLINALAIAVSPCLCVYVLLRLGQGAPAARALAPAAFLLLLYALSAWLGTLGVFGTGALRPDISDAFLAAAAMVLLLSLLPRRAAAETSGSDPEAALAYEAAGAAALGALRIDPAAGQVQLSPQAAAHLGRDPRRCRMSYADWLARIHPEDRAGFDGGIAAGRDRLLCVGFRPVNKGAEACFLEFRGQIRQGVCIGMLCDVTAQHAVAADAARVARQDPLTAAGNREALIRHLDGLGGALKSALLVLVHIDGYCALRRKLGDPQCQLLLKQLAERLRSRFPAGLLFRIHGNGFALVLRDDSAPLAVLTAALMQIGETPYGLVGEGALAPLSVGLAEGRTARDALHLIYNGELALRQAQCHGGSARVYATGMDVLAPSDVEGLDAALSLALESGAIEVIYLPLIRLEDRTVAGFRSRLRWRQLRQGMLEPCELAAHSANAELVAGLQRFIVEHVTAALAEWQQYFPLSEPLFATVPVMPQLLGDDGLDQYLAGEVLPTAALEPDTLKFEIQHRHLSVSSLEQRLPVLKTAGAGFMLSGYAGRSAELRAIGTLPLDIIAFSADRQNGVGDRDALAGCVVRVHGGGARTLISGVESAEDVALIREAGGDLACGGLFSPPLNAGETLKFIAENFRAADSEMAG